jgi:hypothetical protein
MTQQPVRHRILNALISGQQIYDCDSEYAEGESKTYYYDSDKHKIICHRIDVIVGSYNIKEEYSIEEFEKIIASWDEYFIRGIGFDI